MATSKKQTEANRRNAQKSTGPRTKDGKAASRRNAVKHGALSEVVVAQCEEHYFFDNLLESLVDEYEPYSATEKALVDRLALLFWRERRLARAERTEIEVHHEISEVGMPTDPLEENSEEDISEFVRHARGITGSLKFNDQLLIGRYQTMLNNQIKQTVELLRQEQALRTKTIDGVSPDGPQLESKSVRIAAE
ncbi:MAG: hypothetical protein AAF720_12030 [Pseudomonadota bacterium]